MNVFSVKYVVYVVIRVFVYTVFSRAFTNRRVREGVVDLFTIIVLEGVR